MVTAFYIRHQEHAGVPGPPRPSQHFVWFVFLILDILTGAKWYLPLVLIGFSLVTNEVERPLVGVSATPPCTCPGRPLCTAVDSCPNLACLFTHLAKTRLRTGGKYFACSALHSRIFICHLLAFLFWSALMLSNVLAKTRVVLVCASILVQLAISDNI